MSLENQENQNDEIIAIDGKQETFSNIDKNKEELSILNKIKLELNKLKSKLNPKNWGVKDYSDKGNFNSAYIAARKNGEKEFMYKDKRYSSNYNGTPEQQLKETGITDNQLQNKNFIQKNLYNNVDLFGYNLFSAMGAILGIKSNQRKECENTLKDGGFLGEVREVRERKDALNLYLGLPQKYNTFSISKYKPSISTDKNIIYYKLNNADFSDLFNGDILDIFDDPGAYIKRAQKAKVDLKKMSESEFNKKYLDYYIMKKKSDIANTIKGYDNNGTELMQKKEKNLFGVTTFNNVTGKTKVGLGKDARGNYLYYYDIWDIEPDFGKPFEIYDRIYYKNYNGTKKQMFFSDKELKHLDINKKDFDTLALQRELSNRGYDLLNSRKQDGSLDGVLGDETKKALLDWQSKNK